MCVLTRTRRIDADEMVDRFALGELESEFFPADVYDRRVIRDRLESRDPQERAAGSEPVRLARRNVLDPLLAAGYDWYLADLPIDEASFALLRTCADPGWIRLTGGSRLLVDAARRIHRGTVIDPRITAIRDSVLLSTVERRGITLVCQPGCEQLDVVEGHGRLVAFFWCGVLDVPRSFAEPSLEVVVGERC